MYANLELRNDGQKYLKTEMSFRFYQLISQIRLINVHNCRIIVKGEKYIFNEKITCNYCNSLNTVFHIVSACRKYKSKRIQLYTIAYNWGQIVCL